MLLVMKIGGRSRKLMQPHEIFNEHWIWEAHCFDARDRIHSILALIEGSESFEVDYTEDLFSFFLRAGDFFGIWKDDLKMRRFCQALDITSTLLAAALKVRAQDDITVFAEICLLDEIKVDSSRRCSTCTSNLKLGFDRHPLTFCTSFQAGRLPKSSISRHMILHHDLYDKPQSVTLHLGWRNGDAVASYELPVSIEECLIEGKLVYPFLIPNEAVIEYLKASEASEYDPPASEEWKR